jgi:hypothetical protein
MSIEQVEAKLVAAGYRLTQTDASLLEWQYLLVFERAAD